jgi:glucose/arabinose dehydrogenase
MNPTSSKAHRWGWLVIAVGLAVISAGPLAQSSTHPLRLPPPYATPSAVKFAKVIGWPDGKTPSAPSGFAVDVLASELESPRWLYVLPNNDILVSQARTEKTPKPDPAVEQGLRESGSLGRSPNQITLLRDADGDGRFELRTVLVSGLRQPFGMVYLNDRLYVANTDSVVRYPFKVGDTKITSPGEPIVELPGGGYNNHWTRNIVASPGGEALYISVGSQTNADEEGLDAKQPHRAAILRANVDGSGVKVFASGLRNPNGMDWAVGTNVLWTVVNERDLLGDDLVPDFLTAVREGAFYGWPYSYFGRHEDPRQKGKRPDLVAKAVVPDLAIGAHTASLGLLFYRGEAFPERFRGGAFVGQRGSWNRSTFNGYRVAFVPFAGGRPSGPAEDFLTGFVASDSTREVYGRPVGLAMLRDGSLIVADDAGGRIWRVRRSQRL